MDGDDSDDGYGYGNESDDDDSDDNDGDYDYSDYDDEIDDDDNDNDDDDDLILMTISSGGSSPGQTNPGWPCSGLALIPSMATIPTDCAPDVHSSCIIYNELQ